jgi:hypothetical protein
MTSSMPAGQSGTDNYFDINKFEQLLERLESSKERQRTTQDRRDINS